MPQQTQSLADLRRDIATVVYEAANTATPAAHNRGRKPVGFVKVMQNAAMSITATAEDEAKWTDKVIYTRSSATGTAKLEVL